MRSIRKFGHGFTGVLNSEVFRRSPNGRVEVFVDSISFPQGILPYGDGFVIDSQDREPDFTVPGGFNEATDALYWTDESRRSGQDVLSVSNLPWGPYNCNDLTIE